MDNKLYKKEKLCKNLYCLPSGTMSFFTLSTAENEQEYCSIRCQEAVEGRQSGQTDVRYGNRNASLRMGL
jgi:hypothetical protein